MMRALIFLMASVFSLTAAADEIYQNWVSARAAGMGNAFSAVADDYTAVFYNPAGLDKIHGMHITFLAPETGTDILNAISIYQDTLGSNYSQIIHSFFGQLVWMNFEDSLAVAMNDFALVGYTNLTMNFNLQNPPYPNVNWHMALDYGVVGGFATSLLPNNALRVGLVGKRITRYGGDITLGPSTLANLSNSELTSLLGTGTGYGLDAGLLMTVPGPSQFTFSAVWQNIGQTAFVPGSGLFPSGSSGTTPPPMDNDPILGFSMLFDAKAFTLRPALDFTNINLDQSEELGKLMHLGAELGFPGGFQVRGGFNQGYWTAGFGMDIPGISSHLDIASYGVELETYPGQLQDRRYVLQFTSSWDFDLSFDAFKSGGGTNGSGPGGAGAISPGYQRR